MTEHRKAYLKAYNQKYYLMHKERLVAKGIAWNKTNKEKRKVINARYKSKYAADIKRYSLEHRMDQQNRNLKFHHAITLVAYNKLFAEQQGLCLGCKRH